MRTYEVTLIGKTPLLMHHDNIDWADFMDEWKANPENKKTSKAGDDRSPAWRWLGCVYHDGKHVCVPQENIMRALMEGGAMVPVPGGKNGKTFKSLTQSGMMSADPFWRLEVGGSQISWKDVEAGKNIAAFAAHKKAAQELGFELLVKRAKIGTSKHVRVRPMFREWRAIGRLSVWDEQITDKTLAQILEYAGNFKGLGDWRPGGKTPGPYGTFEAEVQ